MRESNNNPFDLNRAADFSDSQILDYWVDFSNGGLIALIEPKSKTTIHLLGGKGSGKTHLMRYCSYPVQKIRLEKSVLQGLIKEGYVGIFSRANTLDTGRFKSKGQDDETWSTLFNYYFEIRLCEQMLLTLLEISESEPKITANLDRASKEAIDLFDIGNELNTSSASSFHKTLVNLRKEIDIAVNNCAFTRTLNVTIRSTAGNLLFGIPELVCKHVKEFKNIQFLYLIDEVENLSTEKQKFLNTLIRHRRGPCSFRIGARLYGIKTQLNYGSDEENKDGSEFKRILLDKAMRSHKGSEGYTKFAKRLCIKRLIDSNILEDINDEKSHIKKLDSYFSSISANNFYEEVTKKLVKENNSKERKYFIKLIKQLTRSIKQVSDLGVNNIDDINWIVENLSYKKYPLIEKVNIFIFYQDWYKRKNLKDSAKKIGDDCSLYCQNTKISGTHNHVYGHFSRDLLAQIYRDYSRKTTPMYAGIDSFILMSAGVPRNLLIILYNVYKWSKFNGEKPFSEVPISIESQGEAILESSNFYYEEDARPGNEIPRLKEVIAKLCEYLREVRYSSKPVEPSPLAFSLDEKALSTQSIISLQQAENWSYIYQIDRGRPNANSQSVDAKYQVNPMLSPKWDLPIGRRGDVRLSNDIIESIFGNKSNNFDAALTQYIAGLNAPSFGRTAKPKTKTIEMDFEKKNEF